MSSIVNGYMNAIERENDMFNRSIEIESNKISLMVEAYYNKLENDYLLAEQKVMMENGTYDDLTYLYMEANEEANQNKETIFQKIKAFFQRIFDSIKNLFRRGDAYEGNAPKCFIDAANGSGSSEIVNFFKKIGNDFKNGNVIGAIETLAKGGLTAFSVCVAIDKGVESASNIIHYPKKAYLKVKDWFDRLTSELQKIESELIAAAQNSNNEKATSFANEVKAKLGKIILWVKGKWEKFVSFFSGVKDKITGNNNEDKGESSEQSGDSGSNSGTRKMKVKGKLTGNNKRNRNSRPASSDSGSNSGTPTNTGTEDDSGDDEEATRGIEDITNETNKNKEKAMPELMNRCKSAIDTLKNHTNKIGPDDSKKIAGINKIMINYKNRKIDAGRAYNDLYNGLDDLYKIIDKVCTKKQKMAQKNKIRDFKAKYNEAGTINESYYLYYDEDEYDIYNEYVEISDYDYDEIDRLFTERSGDPLVDELLDIFDEF